MIVHIQVCELYILFSFLYKSCCHDRLWGRTNLSILSPCFPLTCANIAYRHTWCHFPPVLQRDWRAGSDFLLMIQSKRLSLCPCLANPSEKPTKACMDTQDYCLQRWKMQETDREMQENNCTRRLCWSGGAELDNACLWNVALFM